MVAAEDFTPPDLLHMNQSGQNKRGAVARHEIEN
jgi:hypothetical protein